jgi:hypothetical protein
VYIKSSASTADIFMEYLELIKSLTNIKQIQVLNEEPRPDEKEYINIFTTGDFKLYLKKKDFY